MVGFGNPAVEPPICMVAQCKLEDTLLPSSGKFSNNDDNVIENEAPRTLQLPCYTSSLFPLIQIWADWTGLWDLCQAFTLRAFHIPVWLWRHLEAHLHVCRLTLLKIQPVSLKTEPGLFFILLFLSQVEKYQKGQYQLPSTPPLQVYLRDTAGSIVPSASDRHHKAISIQWVKWSFWFFSLPVQIKVVFIL